MDGRKIFLLILEICLLIHNCIANSSINQGENRIGVRERRSVNKNECLALQVSTNPQLHTFGQTFTELASGLNKIPKNFKGDVILFVGNTGAGKSSLVHILAGEGATFVGKEIGEDTGDYYIEDTSGKFVTNTTISSTTTYPEAVVDATSGAVLFDTPGFRDTRSAIHEIVATYGLHSVAEMSKRIKIALLVNHNSLTPSGPRDDFTNTLESFFSLFNNTHKFQESTYLIATKTPNQHIIRHGKITRVTAETQIKGVSQFLKGVSNTLDNREGNYVNEKFIKNAQALIHSLEGKIALFMKPDDSGPVLESHSIQQSIKSIREMLLSKDGYVEVEVGDFGFAVSDRAKVYIRELYDLMNNHIVEVSKSFAVSFNKFVTTHFKSFGDIQTIKNHLQSTVQHVGHLIQKTKVSTTPSDYVDAIINLADGIQMEFCSRHVLTEIKQLDGYLDGLKKITDHNRYDPSKWSNSLHPLERSVQNELMFYNLIDNLYKKVTDYSVIFKDPTVLRLKHETEFRMPILMAEKFIKHLGLTQFKITSDKLEEVNSFLKKIVGKESIFLSKSNTVVVVDSVLKTSGLHLDKLGKGRLSKTVVLVALRKLYIDSDLVMKGWNLIVIAPEWHVLGKFTLSVDGKDPSATYRGQASPGEHGKDGASGSSAGNFLGVALHYFNSHQLTISASGGNGERGQDGGDGKDGRDGQDDFYPRRWIDDNDSESISPLFNFANSWSDTYIRRADYGSDGGDAGQGGRGGLGGSSGSIKTVQLHSFSPDRSTHRLQDGIKGRDGVNGRPGKGGLRGCDIIDEEYERRILFFTTSRGKKSRFVDCHRRRNFDGTIRPRGPNFQVRPTAVPQPPSICLQYNEVKHLFQDNNDIVSHSTTVEFQNSFKKHFGCY
ncbi:uncharacterized protein LOC111058025 [Nilaparvata lugens]|uniref:uncharacterized protein LOC111058025 n=1 Tax=Nilaparvata lugens TaxID=108931 RepID=UPI00193CD23D|nr:uncharacterized protein LOC111058025 [Nilaparvata lugens]